MGNCRATVQWMRANGVRMSLSSCCYDPSVRLLRSLACSKRIWVVEEDAATDISCSIAALCKTNDSFIPFYLFSRNAKYRLIMRECDPSGDWHRHAKGLRAEGSRTKPRAIVSSSFKSLQWSDPSREWCKCYPNSVKSWENIISFDNRSVVRAEVENVVANIRGTPQV